MGGRRDNILFIFILPVFTGILLGLSALPSPLWFLNFIAFIPLLIASAKTATLKKPLLIFALQLLIALVVFYFWVGFWVLQIANLGFLIGFLIVLPFVILVSPYVLFKRRGNKFAAGYFIAAWLTAEMVQSYFELGSPIFDLGHSLGANAKLIQWYAFTGAAGGTLWILAVNFALFSLGNTLINDRKKWIGKSSIVLGVLLLPMAISIFIFHSYKEKGTVSEVLIVHPSTDCRDVKYQINIYELMDIYLGILLPQLTDNTEYVVLPETAITNSGWVADLNNNLVFDHFHEKTGEYPKLKLVTGAITYDAIPDISKIKGYEKMPGIRYSKNNKVWYYTLNAALHIEMNQPVQLRAKEGLVPYQEYAPYPNLLPYISPLGLDFQFSAKKNRRQVFTAGNGRKTAALICYELVYGNKFLKAAREGAEAFFVLLNEGWYTNVTKVKYQFLQLSVIRAIENRRSIAHASNMGISAFIDQRGIVISKNESSSPGFLKHEIRLSKKRSFAARMGNYLGITAIFTTFYFIFFALFNNVFHR